MSNTQQMKTNTSNHQNSSNPSAQLSALDRFSLGFEYNKTLQEIRREVRKRTA